MKASKTVSLWPDNIWFQYSLTEKIHMAKSPSIDFGIAEENLYVTGQKVIVEPIYHALVTCRKCQDWSGVHSDSYGIKFPGWRLKKFNPLIHDVSLIGASHINLKLANNNLIVGYNATKQRNIMDQRHERFHPFSQLELSSHPW
ncbi:unnamed protein product [Cochlearia groenlandica]